MNTLSEKHKQKIKEGMKRHLPRTIFKKGHKLWLGRKHSEISKEKNRLAHLEEKSSLWKGGISKDRNHIKYMQRIYQRKRRGLGRIEKSVIKLAYINNIKQFGKLTCIYCLNPIEENNSNIDHILPLSKGGGHNKENLTIACKRCNTMKGKKNLINFLIYHTLSILKDLAQEGKIKRMDDWHKKTIFGDDLKEDIWEWIG